MGIGPSNFIDHIRAIGTSISTGFSNLINKIKNLSTPKTNQVRGQVMSTMTSVPQESPLREFNQKMFNRTAFPKDAGSDTKPLFGELTIQKTDRDDMFKVSFLVNPRDQKTTTSIYIAMDSSGNLYEVERTEYGSPRLNENNPIRNPGTYPRETLEELLEVNHSISRHRPLRTPETTTGETRRFIAQAKEMEIPKNKTTWEIARLAFSKEAGERAIPAQNQITLQATDREDVFKMQLHSSDPSLKNQTMWVGVDENGCVCEVNVDPSTEQVFVDEDGNFESRKGGSAESIDEFIRNATQNLGYFKLKTPHD